MEVKENKGWKETDSREQMLPGEMGKAGCLEGRSAGTYIQAGMACCGGKVGWWAHVFAVESGIMRVLGLGRKEGGHM